MKKIPCGHGQFALVDDADYAVLSRFLWMHRTQGGRAICVRTKWRDGGVQRMVSMGKLLAGRAGAGRQVRFINGDRFDHRRANLEPAGTPLDLPQTLRLSELLAQRQQIDEEIMRLTLKERLKS